MQVRGHAGGAGAGESPQRQGLRRRGGVDGHHRSSGLQVRLAFRICNELSGSSFILSLISALCVPYGQVPRQVSNPAEKVSAWLKQIGGKSGPSGNFVTVCS